MDMDNQYLKKRIPDAKKMKFIEKDKILKTN